MSVTGSRRRTCHEPFWKEKSSSRMVICWLTALKSSFSFAVPLSEDIEKATAVPRGMPGAASTIRSAVASFLSSPNRYESWSKKTLTAGPFCETTYTVAVALSVS